MGHLEVVQMLVKHGGELNVFDEQGISPGYFAATRNNYEMLEWMIEYENEPHLFALIFDFVLCFFFLLFFYRVFLDGFILLL